MLIFSHASGFFLCSRGLLYCHHGVDFLVLYWNISAIIEWIGVKLGTHIHGPRRMNCNNLHHLTFSSSI